MKNLYKILLVDDEDEIRGRIASLINEESGFQVVGKAGNGHDAYELVETLKPDVVLTDIKMPFIDGMELARMLKRDYPTVKVAFISGYDEFKYAREAIHLNVINYLMKPLSLQDIQVFLQDLRLKLDEEYRRKFNIEEALKHYQESIPLIVNHQVNSLLISNEVNDKDLEVLEKFGLNIYDGYRLACLIEIESSEDSIELVTLEKVRVLYEELLNQTNGVLQFEHHLFVHNGLFFWAQGEKDILSKEIDMFLYELLQNAETYMNIRIRIGISRRFYQLKELARAYDEAKKAIGYGKFLNTGRIVYINEVEKRKTTKLMLDAEDIKELENVVKFGKEQELVELLDKHKKMIHAEGQVLINHEMYVISLANLITHFSESLNEDIHKLLGDDFLNKMLAFSDVDSLFDWTYQKLILLRRKHIENNYSRTEQILHDALEYVDINYADTDLSLNKVCDILEISVSYLSMLLKRDRNLTFNKYVITIRMEKAKQLLKETNHKIVDIALMCGYNEVYYFSHSFKKYTNMSPKKYREGFHA